MRVDDRITVHRQYLAAFQVDALTWSPLLHSLLASFDDTMHVCEDMWIFYDHQRHNSCGSFEHHEQQARRPHRVTRHSRPRQGLSVTGASLVERRWNEWILYICVCTNDLVVTTYHRACEFHKGVLKRKKKVFPPIFPFKSIS